MAVFLIERNFAQQLEVTPEVAQSLNEINEESGVRWLTSFLSADKRKTYCLYEATDPEAIRKAAARAGVPADVVVEVTELTPRGTSGPVRQERFS
jgi:hypothetical protein